MENIIEFEVFDEYDLVAKVIVDGKRKVHVTYFEESVDTLNDPLPMDNPTIEDVANYLESRCFPETRHNKREILDLMDLENYIPMNIARKTHGLIHEDYIWLRFKGETIEYDDIKIRD